VSALLDPAAFELARDLDVTQRLDGAVLVQPSGRLLAAWPHASTLGGPGATDIAELPLFAPLPRPFLSAAGAETADLGAAIVAMAPVRNAPILAMAAVSRDRALAAWHAEWRLTLAAIAVLIAAIGFIGLRLGHRHARRREAVVRTLSVLARAVEDSPAMTVITGPDGTLEYANRTFEEVTGFDREEVVGTTPASLAAGHAQPGALDDLWSAVRAGRGWDGVIETKKKTGEAFWLSLSVSPIADAHGRVTNFVAVGSDVTERIENERYRRRTEKAQALRTLVDGIAHEFNNLLTPMLTMTRLAMEGLPAGSRERQMLEVASRAAQRASDLVRRVRIFARDDPEKWQVHDAAGLVKDAVAAAGATLPAGVTLKTGIEDGIGRMRADSPQIETAMMNLIANAIDAIGPVPGTVTVRLSRAEPDDGGARPPPDLAPGPYAVLSVSDTGQGIAPEVAERMFDPFFSTREVGQGTGLGLSIVQGVVTTHGGAVTVDSQPGAGTTFHLFLPLLDASADETETWTPTPDWPQQASR
jgi:PAS domain S-box-containing protein